MNHKLYFFLLFAILVCSSPSRAFVEVKDEALLACINTAMKNQNVSSPQELSKLKCHKKGIKSLEGIQYYTGLTSLSLFSNQITKANLQALHNLKTLNLSKNKLSSIEISGLDALESLFIFDNRLRTVDFSGLERVEKIRAMKNQLEKLDITPLVSLKEAYFWDNQLEDLQITGLKHLKFLDVKQNPMPDQLYDFYDEQTGITISHDGNADDWK